MKEVSAPADFKKEVIECLKKALKTDDSVAQKIFNHYQKEFDAAAGSNDPKGAVKTFLKNVKNKKEEYEGNVPPQEADWIDTRIRREEKNSF